MIQKICSVLPFGGGKTTGPAQGPVSGKHDPAQVRPLFEAAAAMLSPNARAERYETLLERGAFRLKNCGLALPEELTRMVAAQLSPEAATNVELAFFTAFSPGLQQVVLTEVYGVVMRQRRPEGKSWQRHLNELSRLQLPRTDVECVYRAFAGSYPAALASVRPWRDPSLQALVSTQRVSVDDADEVLMRMFFSWAGQPCSHTLLRDREQLIFIGSGANRHPQGYSDSPYGTPNQVALTFAPAGELLGTDMLLARGIASDRLTHVDTAFTSFQPPVLSDVLKERFEVVEDHILKFVPPGWTIGYKDVNCM